MKQTILQSINNGEVRSTDEGLLLPRQGILVTGEYFLRQNGGEWERVRNLVTTEGLAHLLNVAFGSTAKPTSYYLALFSGSVSPAANWTAATFAAAAGEVVSMTEGYTAATRPAWTPVNTSTGSIDNMSSVASLTMATAGSLNVTGSAMLTNNVRGGTTGVLISASRYPVARTFQAGDTFDIGYRISLTV